MEAVESSKSCPNCDAKIRQHALFCHKCGFSFDIIKETETTRSAVVREDVKKSFAEWFTPSIETHELDTGSLAPNEKTSAKENTGNKDLIPATELVRDHQENLMRENELKINQAKTDAKTGELKSNVNRDETAQINIEEADIKRRVAELKKSNEFTSEEISALKEISVKENLAPENNLREDDSPKDNLSENTLPENTLPENTLPEINEDAKPEKPAGTKRTTRTMPPRRQISKTKEYIWEEPQRDATPWFFLVALIALAGVLTIFWLSGFLKI